MIQNNFAIAGTTGILYNIELSNLFQRTSTSDDNIPVITELDSLTEIGIKYKKSSDSSYTKIVLIGNLGHNITYLSSVPSGNFSLTNDIIGIRYDTYKGHIYPCRILIKNLLPETSYDLVSYYVNNNVEYTYNAQTITTLNQSGTVVCTNIAWTTNANLQPPEEQRESLFNLFSSGISELVEVANIFCPVDWQFDVTLYYQAGAPIAGDSGMRFNTAYGSTVDYVRSTAMHEFAHVNFVLLYSDRTAITKFMEFATSIEGATWKNGAGAHNYPIISSARYSYMDDCLVAAACWLTQRS